MTTAVPRAWPALPPALRRVLALIAMTAVVVPAVLVRQAPPPLRPQPPIVAPRRVVPPTELPPVEPVALQVLDPRDARIFNASIPFSALPNPPARPFYLNGSTQAHARAVDCLAVAVLYEAGDDTLGERAVAQVIVNRARHPAFPKSICGVVFQGSDRATGCQFTFTCDGALARWRPSDAAWRRARAVATAALNGSVLAQVGYATHYHTDWVVPYWSSSLDKVVAVETHLFFRWTGWWGTPAAFRRSISGDEPAITALAPFSDAHRAGAVMAESNAATIAAAAVTGGAATGGSLSIDPNSFIVTLDPGLAPEAFQAVALRTCGARDYCKLMAWTDRKLTPASLPLDQGQIVTMAFSFLRDRQRGYEKALWNCGQFKRAGPGQCMKLQVLGTIAAPVPGGRAAQPPVAVGGAAPQVTFRLSPATPDGLGGVRRKVLPTPPAIPGPAPVPKTP
ncbi:cell wall hydrolase [uncultured Sphingomonas sp.]|uniref:cell wall hydrolase n=1 Tax=uncultured Sphingomonas sp. TaxID=158754 RepID=UPI0035CB248C